MLYYVACTCTTPITIPHHYCTLFYPTFQWTLLTKVAPVQSAKIHLFYSVHTYYYVRYIISQRLQYYIGRNNLGFILTATIQIAINNLNLSLKCYTYYYLKGYRLRQYLQVGSTIYNTTSCSSQQMALPCTLFLLDLFSLKF